MKINFDNIVIQENYLPKSRIKSPVKIQFEAPIYEQFVRELSLENYEKEVLDINQMMMWPQQMGKFLQNQVEKQLVESSSTSSIKLQSPIYFANKSTYRQIQTKINKNVQKQKQNSNKNSNFEKHKKLNGKMGQINYKKHECKDDEMSSQARKTLTEMNQFTYKPKVLPCSPKMSTKVLETKRVKTENIKNQPNDKIFDGLYKQAKKRKIKNLLKTIEEQVRQSEQTKPKINSNYFKNNPTSTYTSIYERLNNIIYKKQIKRRQQQKYDLTEMRLLFKPDLHLSQESFKIFVRSVSKQKQRQNSQKKNTNVKSKQHKCFLSSKDLFASRVKTTHRQHNIDTRTIDYFTEIFHSHNQKSNKQPVTNPLTKEEFLILQNFLIYIEELQSKKYETETTVSTGKTSTASQAKKNVLSKQEFKQKFKKFYERLSLHDKLTLRKEILTQQKDNSARKKQRQQPINYTFKPQINARSSSLDNVAQGHSKRIYYV